MNLLSTGFLFILLHTNCGLLPDYSWPQWESFKANYISPDGRVIDPSQRITTSEGQSYALFFALIANDRAMFNKLLSWTENNLAAGDLSTHLPGWLWGSDPKKTTWQLLDPNSASDADAWMAYDLLEAGRLWHNTHYRQLGLSLLARIEQEEIADIPGLGPSLMPGKLGFAQSGYWRLNPSYSPPQLLEYFTQVNSSWSAVAQTSKQLLLDTAPKGFSPNWVIWRKKGGWQADIKQPNLGSYDAIRVYLWTGMLADGKEKTKYASKFQAMLTSTIREGHPPEEVNTATGQTIGQGPLGFSAALLPLLENYGLGLVEQRQRVYASAPQANNYYNTVLSLFGKGWDEKRYRFTRQGYLLPSWAAQCALFTY